MENAARQAQDNPPSPAPGGACPTSSPESCGGDLLQSHDEQLVAAAEVNVLGRAFDQARQRSGPPKGAPASIAAVLPAAAREIRREAGAGGAGGGGDADWKRRQDEAAERAERAERVRACFARANVLPKFQHARLADLEQVPADTIEAYTETVRRLSVARTMPGFYALIGAIGDGKTRMLNALVNEFCLEGRSAKYMDAADYIAGVRACWGSKAEAGGAGAEERYVQQHVRFSLLAIDEITMRRGTPDENGILLRLFKKRDDAGVTTVVAGNYASKQEFEEAVDARIGDRMCDGGGVIFCDWPSLRGRIAR